MKEKEENNKLEIFRNKEFGEIQIIENNGKFEFEATGMAKILGYANTVDAIQRHCKKDGVVKHEVGVQTGYKKDGTPAIQMIEKNFINEGNLYRLITHSKLPSAEKFESWVFDEVLPSIRKTGGYIAGEENMNEDELILKAMNVLNTKVEKLKIENKNLLTENNKQNQIIGELKPKADYTDRILQCEDLTKVNVIACDYGFTAIEFNKLLRKLGIQYREGKDWLLYKQYRGKGYTQTKTFNYEHKNGTKGSKTTMYWTQKGRLFIYEFLKSKGIFPRIEETQMIF